MVRRVRRAHGRDARERERVVVHLERAVAHDLEPVHDGLDGRGGVEVRVRGELLRGRDVARAPREEEGQRGVDDGREDGRVEDLRPGRGGAEDGFAPEEEEKERGSWGRISDCKLTRGGETYDDFINPSTIGAARPAGLIAGASAMNTFTFWLSWGCMLSAAKACAVPWLNPM